MYKQDIISMAEYSFLSIFYIVVCYNKSIDAEKTIKLNYSLVYWLVYKSSNSSCQISFISFMD